MVADAPAPSEVIALPEKYTRVFESAVSVIWNRFWKVVAAALPLLVIFAEKVGRPACENDACRSVAPKSGRASPTMCVSVNAPFTLKVQVPESAIPYFSFLVTLQLATQSPFEGVWVSASVSLVVLLSDLYAHEITEVVTTVGAPLQEYSQRRIICFETAADVEFRLR